MKLISRTLSLSLGFPLFISGILGNLLNVRLFWMNRQNSCTFLLLCSSASNCIVLVCGLLDSILLTGLEIDWSHGSHLWCRSRRALNQAFWLISLSCTCLASVERYLITSRHEKYRKLSRSSLAQWSVAFFVLLWSCHAVPYAIFTDLALYVDANNGTGWVCVFAPNSMFANYRNYFSLPFLFGLFPCVLLSVMGFLTYQNISSLGCAHGRRAAQLNLTKLLLVQIPLVVLPSSPFIIFTIYKEITKHVVRSTEQMMIEDLSSTVLMLLFYITYTWPFFVFFISSKTFRQDTKQMITCHWRLLHSGNRVGSIPTRTTTAAAK